MRELIFFLSITTILSCTNKSSENSISQSLDTTPKEPSITEVAQKEIPVDTTGLVVYITHEGNKYHTAECRYAKSSQAVRLSQAKADGKTACDVCKPNAKTGEKQIRCSAKTKEGKQCQRMTTDVSGKCFQHK